MLLLRHVTSYHYLKHLGYGIVGGGSVGDTRVCIGVCVCMCMHVRERAYESTYARMCM